jgi:hypothetical protein
VTACALLFSHGEEENLPCLDSIKERKTLCSYNTVPVRTISQMRKGMYTEVPSLLPLYIIEFVLT